MIRFSIIAATGRNLAIGFQNQLLWNISEDLRRFKEITMGNPIVMGRKTFDSIGRPLPGRANIILTRDSEFFQKNVSVAHSIEESYDKALSLCSRDACKEAFIIGGEQIYKLWLPFVSRLYLTEVESEKIGDAFFPAIDQDDWEVKDRRPGKGVDNLKYTFVTLDRKESPKFV